MIIHAVLWKGCYDLTERGLENLFTSILNENVNITTNKYTNTTSNNTNEHNFLNPNELSLITNGIIGYGTYFILVLLKKNFRKILQFWRFLFKSKQSEIFLLDIIHYSGYWSLVLIWRTIWGVYDYKLFGSINLLNISLLTHFSTFLIASCFGITTALYGPDGGDSEEIKTPGVKFDKDKTELSFDTSVYIN